MSETMSASVSVRMRMSVSVGMSASTSEMMSVGGDERTSSLISLSYPSVV